MKRSGSEYRILWVGFAAIALIFTAPIAFLFHFMFQEQAKTVESTRREIVGVQRIGPLQEMMPDLIDHKMLKFSARDTAIAGRLSLLEKRIAERVSAMWEFDQFLDIDDHDKLLDHVRTTITVVGESSALVIDPDIDAYHLMDATIRDVPQLQARLEVLGTLLLGRRNTGLSQAERDVISSNISLLQESDLAGIRSGVASALKADSTATPKDVISNARLPEALENLNRSLSLLEDYLSELAHRRIPVDRQVAYQKLSDSVYASERLRRTATEDFENLLKDRLASQISARNRYFVLTALIWMASILLVIYFSAWVIRRIRDQEATIVSSSKLSSLGEMVGNIAHEVNNPTATIKITSEQLIEFLGEPEMDRATLIEMATTIRETATRIGKIVHAMRCVSRDGSNDPMNVESLQGIVDQVAVLCQERFKGRSVEFRIGRIPQNLHVRCRAVEITQVLLNLLNNSVDAIEGLSARWIEIGVLEKGDRVEIGVTDSGAGIPAKLREKLFTPFFTTKPIGKGTGLGLGICRKIVEVHGGELRYDDQSKNTRFVFSLEKVPAIASAKAA